jgi:hypothetical protein
MKLRGLERHESGNIEWEDDYGEKRTFFYNLIR